MAKKTASALPASADIPQGMRKIGGGYSATWDPKEGDVIHGPTTSPVKTVEMTIGRRKQERRCVEVADKHTGNRSTVWESAALGALFDELVESGQGTIVWIRFDGLGKAKKGQNPPKLFSAAIAA